MGLLRYFDAVAPAASEVLAREARTSATAIFGLIKEQTFTEDD